MKGLGPSLLRLAVGTVFVAHGLVKLLPVPGGGVPETVALFESLQFQAPYAVAMILGWVEVSGGVALVLGAYTGWTAFALLLTTAVTSWKLHLPHGLFLNWSLEPGVGHGYEFDLLLIGALLSDGDRRRQPVSRPRPSERCRAGGGGSGPSAAREGGLVLVAVITTTST